MNKARVLRRRCASKSMLVELIASCPLGEKLGEYLPIGCLWLLRSISATMKGQVQRQILGVVRVLDWEPALQPALLPFFVCKCPSLRSINLIGCKEPQLGPAGLQALGWHCRQLQAVNLANTGLSDHSLSYLVKYCPTLCAMDLSSTCTTDAGLRCIGDHCGERLRRLRLYQCGEVSDVGVVYLTERCTQLRALGFMNNERISDLGVFAVAVRCPHMRTVKLMACPEVGDLSVCALARRCALLERINLRSHGAGVSGRAVADLCAHCPRLVSLKLLGCGLEDASLPLIAGLPRLWELSIGACLFTEAGLLDFGQRCQPGLRRLMVEFMPWAVSDAVLLRIARRCPRLEQLCCSGAKISSAALAAITADGYLLRLTQFDVTNCDGVSAQATRDFCASRPGIIMGREWNVATEKSGSPTDTEADVQERAKKEEEARTRREHRRIARTFDFEF